MFAKILISLCFVLTLVACSNAPSETDSKNVLLNELGSCNRVSLQSFEKVNGVENQNGTYKISLKYALNVAPTSDADQKKNYQMMIAEDGEKLRSLENDLKIGNEKILELMEKNRKGCMECFTEKKELEEKLKPMQQQYSALKSKIEKSQDGAINGFINDCKNMSPMMRGLIQKAAYDYTKENDHKSPFLDGFVANLNTDFNLVKTEKGWQLSR